VSHLFLSQSLEEQLALFIAIHRSKSTIMFMLLLSMPELGRVRADLPSAIAAAPTIPVLLGGMHSALAGRCRRVQQQPGRRGAMEARILMSGKMRIMVICEL
jgi:hypothetical protein